MKLAWVNGEMVEEGAAGVSVLDRGFTLGDGVFETMRAVGGRVFRVEDHLRRLGSSAEAIGMALPLDNAGLRGAMLAVLEANGLSDALVRPTVTRGVPTSRGLPPPEEPSPTVAVVVNAFSGCSEDAYQRGYRAVVSSIRRNEWSPVSRIKSCNYLDAVLARMEASRRGADEALMLNTAGNVACGSSSNLFLVVGGSLVTPNLESGVLDGVTRRAVLEIARELGIAWEQRVVAAGEVAVAEELFVTNTAVGVMPIVAVNGRAVGAGVPGPVCRRVWEGYERMVEAACGW